MTQRRNPKIYRAFVAVHDPLKYNLKVLAAWTGKKMNALILEGIECVLEKNGFPTKSKVDFVAREHKKTEMR